MIFESFIRLFDASAPAAEAAASVTSGVTGQSDNTLSLITTVLMIVGLIAVFYFFLYRPQKKKDKETKAMLDAVALGDVVTTGGGIVGVVVRIKGDMLLIETGAARTQLQVARWAIRTINEKSDNN